MDNKKPAVDILGVPVTPFSMAEAVAWLMERVDRDLPTQVVTANAEIIMMAQQMPAYKALLDKYSLKAEECVFIDDNLANVQAAFTLGFVGIRMKESVGTLIRSLATCNVALR